MHIYVGEGVMMRYSAILHMFYYSHYRICHVMTIFSLCIYCILSLFNSLSFILFCLLFILFIGLICHTAVHCHCIYLYLRSVTTLSVKYPSGANLVPGHEWCTVLYDAGPAEGVVGVYCLLLGCSVKKVRTPLDPATVILVRLFF